MSQPSRPAADADLFQLLKSELQTAVIGDVGRAIRGGMSSVEAFNKFGVM